MGHKPKTFAEKLGANTKYTEEMSSIAEKLIKLSEIMRKNGNIDESERLLDQAERIIELANDAGREFLSENGKTLKELMNHLSVRRIKAKSQNQ